LMLLLVCLSAHAGQDYKWVRQVQIDPSAVTINFNVVRPSELRIMMRKRTRTALNNRVLYQNYKRGLAILDRSTELGTCRCEVYVVSLQDAQTIEHEIRHCHGWVHQ